MPNSQTLENIKAALLLEKKPECAVIADMLRAMAAVSPAAAERIAAIDLGTKKLADCVNSLRAQASKKGAGNYYAMCPEESIKLTAAFYGLQNLPELTLAAVTRAHLDLLEAKDAGAAPGAAQAAESALSSGGKVVSLFDLI